MMQLQRKLRLSVRQEGEIHGFHKKEWLFLHFPAELSETAASISEITGKHYDIKEIITSVIEEFKILFEAFLNGKWEEILLEINELSYLKEKKVHLKINRAYFLGIVKNINHNGELEILIDDKIHTFSVGEVFEEKMRVIR